MDFLKGMYHGVLQGDVNSICFAVLLFVIVLAVFRAMFNLAIVAVLGCVVLIAIFNYSPQEIYYQTENAIEKAKQVALKHALPLLTDKWDKATITTGKNGTYTVLVGDIKLEGKKGNGEILLYFKNEKYTLSVDSLPKEIQEALHGIESGVQSTTEPIA